MKGYCGECKKEVRIRYEEDDEGNITYHCVECNCEIDRLTGR